MPIRTLSQETKDKIRDKAIGRKVSSSTREAMSNSSNRYRQQRYKFFNVTLDGLEEKLFCSERFIREKYKISFKAVKKCLKGEKHKTRNFEIYEITN